MFKYFPFPRAKESRASYTLGPVNCLLQSNFWHVTRVFTQRSMYPIINGLKTLKQQVPWEVYQAQRAQRAQSRSKCSFHRCGVTHRDFQAP